MKLHPLLDPTVTHFGSFAFRVSVAAPLYKAIMNLSEATGRTPEKICGQILAMHGETELAKAAYQLAMQQDETAERLEKIKNGD